MMWSRELFLACKMRRPGQKAKLGNVDEEHDGLSSRSLETEGGRRQQRGG